MKISEITQSRIVREGQVEPNLMLSIRNIIQRGRADNTFEFIVVARLLELLKNGSFYKSSNPVFDSNLTTSKEVLDHLRALPPADMLAIATKMWELLQVKDQDLLYNFSNPNQEYFEWLKWFTAREAND